MRGHLERPTSGFFHLDWSWLPTQEIVAMKVRSPARRCRAAAGRRRGRPAMRLKRFSTCLADTAFARREYKPLILAGQNREQGVRLQLSEVEEDIMQQTSKLKCGKLIPQEPERHVEQQLMKLLNESSTKEFATG